MTHLGEKTKKQIKIRIITLQEASDIKCFINDSIPNTQNKWMLFVVITSAISLYLPSMEVRRSIGPCFATGIPGKEYWKVKRWRPPRRSTRERERMEGESEIRVLGKLQVLFISCIHNRVSLVFLLLFFHKHHRLEINRWLCLQHNGAFRGKNAHAHVCACVCVRPSRFGQNYVNWLNCIPARVHSSNQR